MNNIIKILGSILVVMVLLFGLVYVNNVSAPKEVTYGQVGDAFNYSTTTDSTWNAAATVTGGYKLLKTGPGLFVGFCVTNETAGSITFYDATSTNHGDYATSTTMLKWNVFANQAEGCYYPRIPFNKGLIAEFQSPNVASGTPLWN